MYERGSQQFTLSKRRSIVPSRFNRRSEVPKDVTRRYAEIDMIKVIGILAVLLIHCLRPVWSPHASPMEHFLNQELRFAVPGFLFCSGFLYAKSLRFGWDDTRSRLVRILIPYFVASVGAEIWRFVDGRPRNVAGIAEDLLLGGAFGHYYYVFVIVGLVIATPVFGRMSRPALIGTTLFIFAFQFGTIAMETITGTPAHTVVPRFWLVRLPLLWWNFFLLGWLLRQDYDRLRPWVMANRSRVVGALLVLCGVFSAAQILDVPGIVAETSSWLQIPTIIGLIMALFCGRETLPGVVRRASEATFAIYLFHIFFLVWVQPFVPHARGFLDPGVVLAQFAAGLLGPPILIALGHLVLKRHSRLILGA